MSYIHLGKKYCSRCHNLLEDGDFMMCERCKREQEEENEIESIIKKVLDYRKRESRTYKDYEIQRLNRYSLCYKTFLTREARKNEIEICEWDKDFSSRWTIASFEYDAEYDRYILVSCGDRMKDIKDWEAFGALVQVGYIKLLDY